MPEMIRSVVSRVRVYFKDRRQSPRLRVRLLFSISVRRKAKANGASPSDRTLKGHTRDISVNGLAMMLPQVHLEGHHLAADGRELHVLLELPAGAIPLVVIPRRYEKLDESELGCNYLIGAKIIQITDEDRMRLQTYIACGVKPDPPNPDLRSVED
jgi:c-di-GMP-binding flagellar brake protein YcgR